MVFSTLAWAILAMLKSRLSRLRPRSCISSSSVEGFNW
jgi:hypothetical protein